jgi:hypothetical protein
MGTAPVRYQIAVTAARTAMTVSAFAAELDADAIEVAAKADDE